MSEAPTHRSGLDPRDRNDVERISRDFALLYHDLRDQTLGRTRWLGVSIVKTPMDMIVLQEIVAETRPTLIIETGVFAGGSALYMASLLELLDIDGKVIGIDVDLSGVSPHIGEHPRIELVEGSSTDPDIVARLRDESQEKRVMVDLDADHSADHVLAELRAFGPLVTPDCYLIVEDTWLGGRPVRAEETPGPAEALEEWLAEGQPFDVDRWRERLLLTGSGGGYLRRRDPAGRRPGGPPRLDEFAASGLGKRVAAPRPSVHDAHATRVNEGQAVRNAHEAEYNSLRVYAQGLERESDSQRRRLREQNRLLAELRSQLGGVAGGGPQKGSLVRARRRALRLPALRRIAGPRPMPPESERQASSGHHDEP